MFEEVDKMFDEIREHYVQVSDTINKMKKEMRETATLNDYAWLVFGKLLITIECDNSSTTYGDLDALTLFFYNHREDLVEEVTIDYIEGTAIIKLEDKDNEI